MFFIIQHADAGQRIKYFPLFQKAAEEGALERRLLAMMEDRILTDAGKKQKYGTQVSMTNTGTSEPFPMEDPWNVDKRRAEIGLGPIREYMEHFGIDWADYLAKQIREKH